MQEWHGAKLIASETAEALVKHSQAIKFEQRLKIVEMELKLINLIVGQLQEI